MSVYIKGMEMPTEGFITVTITSDGRVVGNSQKINGKFEYLDNKDIASAIPVPDHGRLIDADAYLSTIRPICDEDAYSACTFETVKRLMIEHINDAPTIIPADPPVMFYPQVPGITPTVISDKEGEG